MARPQPAGNGRGASYLSFDGGGIRGYASLLILEALMREIKIVEEDPGQLQSLPEGTEGVNMEPATSSFHPHDCSTLGQAYLPCHYFDYMIGSSTGGLIAIMLGRFRMPVDRAMKQYKDLGGRVFGSPRLVHKGRLPLIALQNKFSASTFTTVINEVCDAHGHAVRANCVFSAVPLAAHTGGCKTAVLALGAIRDTGISDAKVLFRSYETKKSPDCDRYPLNPGPACGLPVWMVARAITAAPTYFKHITIPDTMGNQWVFIDGGLEKNNPTWEGYKELKWGTDSPPEIAVSIGACRQNREILNGKYNLNKSRWLMKLQKARKAHGGNTKDADEDMQSVGINYWRFDDNKRGVRRPQWKQIKMDEWKDGKDGTLSKMQRLVREYLADTAVGEELRECAKRLVKHRRLRLQRPQEWQEFACPTWNYQYGCSTN